MTIHHIHEKRRSRGRKERKVRARFHQAYPTSEAFCGDPACGLGPRNDWDCCDGPGSIPRETSLRSGHSAPGKWTWRGTEPRGGSL